MSALEEYRQADDAFGPEIRRQRNLAAIAELSAEANKWCEDWGDAQKRIAELEAAITDLQTMLNNEMRRAEQAEAERDQWHHACDAAAENGVTIRRSLERAEVALVKAEVKVDHLHEVLEQNAAELAALRARRCHECDRFPVCEIFECSRWAAREEGK